MRRIECKSPTRPRTRYFTRCRRTRPGMSRTENLAKRLQWRLTLIVFAVLMLLAVAATTAVRSIDFDCTRVAAVARTHTN